MLGPGRPVASCAMDRNWLAEARPHLRRAALYALLAIVGMIAASQGDIKGAGDPGLEPTQIVAGVGAAILLFVGIAAVRAAARAARASTSGQLGDARGAALGFVITAFGYFVVLMAVLNVLDVPISGLLLGGAITGVIIGIAAQQTLGNFFAGMVLMAVRPVSVGEYAVLRSGPLGGEYEGTVMDMGMFYVDLMTDHGPVKLPNAGVLASAIGPGARAPKGEPEDEEQQPAPPSEGGP